MERSTYKCSNKNCWWIIYRNIHVGCVAGSRPFPKNTSGESKFRLFSCSSIYWNSSKRKRGKYLLNRFSYAFNLTLVLPPPSPCLPRWCTFLMNSYIIATYIHPYSFRSRHVRKMINYCFSQKNVIIFFRLGTGISSPFTGKVFLLKRSFLHFFLLLCCIGKIGVMFFHCEPVERKSYK